MLGLSCETPLLRRSDTGCVHATFLCDGSVRTWMVGQAGGTARVMYISSKSPQLSSLWLPRCLPFGLLKVTPVCSLALRDGQLGAQECHTAV